MPENVNYKSVGESNSAQYEDVISRQEHLVNDLYRYLSKNNYLFCELFADGLKRSYFFFDILKEGDGLFKEIHILSFRHP